MARDIVSSEGTVTLRTEVRPGDIGYLTGLHGRLYAEECGFDPTFEALVAGLVSAIATSTSPRERLWIAERNGDIVGCCGIATVDDETAQFHVFLVHPDVRGAGLGRRLLGEAIAFARRQGYRSIVLETVSVLAAAAHLYRAFGFRKVEEHALRRWGVDVVDETYALDLAETTDPGIDL